LMYGFEGDLGELLMQSASGPGALSISSSAWSRPSACIVLASYGYPDRTRTGDTITGIEAAEAGGAVIFQAGTRRSAERLVTNGGRVLGVTAGGEDLQAALDRAYQAAAKIRFNDMHYRRDIGQKGLARYR